MKKTLILSFVCLFNLLFYVGAIKAQGGIYQLPNGDFEGGWVREVANTAGSIVPVGWHSFYSGSGSLISSAQSWKTDSSLLVRPGSTGRHSVKIWSHTALIVRANGNLTTGRINAGNMSASHADNHNYTQVPNFATELTGTPDSLGFWARFKPGRNGATNFTDEARIRVLVHGIGECRDAANYPSGKTEQDYYYGRAVKNFMKGDGGWYYYQVPFVYDGLNIEKNGDNNYYVLVSLTTNALPAGGLNVHDTVWFDEIELLYSPWLNDLRVNNVTIDGFQKGLLTYGGPTLTGTPGAMEFPYLPSAFSWTPEVPDIVGVEVTNVPGPLGDADGGYTSILVTAEDGVTQKEYRMYYYSNLSPNNNMNAVSYTIDGTTEIAVPGFVPTQTTYNISIVNPEEVRVPQIVEESIVLADETATIQRIEQPTGVNSIGKVVVKAENLSLKSYNLIFSKVQSTNSKLNWIKIANVDIPDFDPDILTYTYNVTTCTTTIPAVTYEKASVWASDIHTPATLANRTATIRVTAESGDITVYSITFVFTNNNTTINGYRVNTTARSNVFTAANNYTDTYSASFTAVPTLQAATATGQIGCSGATQVFPTAEQFKWFPDTNKIVVTAMDLISQQTYGSVIKNTNCYLLQTTGNNVGLKYLYNGVVRNITVPSANNNNDVTINVTIPVVGPNEPPILIEAMTQAPVVDTIIYTQPTSRAGNSGRVRVVANDQVAGKNYIINFTPTISNDATLSYIHSNGALLPGFNPATDFYTLIFPSNITDLPEIDYAPTFEWLPEENIIYEPALAWEDTTKIMVTAENGTTNKTYKIEYYHVPREKDAYLSDIKVFDISIPGFNPLKFVYTVDIPYSASLPPQTIAFASSPTAHIFPSQDLTIAPYTKEFLVYSEDMSVYNIYTVHFNRVKNNNPYLADIMINNVSLQDFYSEVFDYEHELSYTVLDPPVVTAVPVHPFANVTITPNPITFVNGTATINVIAEDEDFTATYTLNLSRALSPIAKIASITYEYNDVEYAYEITGNETEVTFHLPVETLGIPEITEVVLTDFRAHFEIEEQPDETNDLVGTVGVTAEDLTEETYLFTFQKTLSPSTLITMIYVDGTPLQGFDPEIFTYAIMRPFNASSIPVVTAIAAWAGTQVNVSNIGTPFGTATITVISEDGQHSKNYSIIFQREGNPYLVDLSYTLDGVTYLIPGFNPAVLQYEVDLQIATTATPIVNYVLEDSRCTTEINNTPASPNDYWQMKIVTWNQADSVTYRINFRVILSTDALLFDLTVDGITIEGFDKNIFVYNYPKYEYGHDLPYVDGVPEELDAHADPIQISEFPGTATVTVTAGDGISTKIYSVHFTIDPGNNTYLYDLTLDGTTLWNFVKNVYDYEFILDYGTPVFPLVDGIAEDPNSTVDRIQATFENPMAQIIVTSLNGDVAEYRVHFTFKGSNNAFASMIYIDFEPLEGFDKYEHYYDFYLPANYSGIPDAYALPEDPNATSLPQQKYLFTNPPHTELVIIAEDGDTDYKYYINWIKLNTVLSYNNEVDIQVYPNPCSNYIHFDVSDLNQTSNLEIFSVEGKQVGIHILYEGINRINIEHLQNGLYFYKVNTNKTMLGAGKFVKN